MLQAPIEGYEDPIVVPPINANNFELKQTLINLVQSNQFTGRQDPHNHLCFVNKSRKFVLHEDQIIAIISVHSPEEEMIIRSYMITSSSFKPQQSKQDDFQNQMMQFMQNLYNKPSTSNSSSLPSTQGSSKSYYHQE
nr:reverse transcriptase domain-containing protein [Tanacetum cinerariifolium]